MKPHLSKYERKALRFAYQLMRGDYTTYIPYVHGLILRYEKGRIRLLPGYWIEPDRDPERPYLNEATFTHLMVQGFLDCKQFLPQQLWLYRLSRTGCTVMGWDWPLPLLAHGSYRPTPQSRRQEQEFDFNRRRKRGIWSERHRLRDIRNIPFRHRVDRRLYK